MEQQVTDALERAGWDAAAARAWMLANFGQQTPALAVFEQVREGVAEAYWREVVQWVGVTELPARETEARAMMGALDQHLSDDARAAIIREEQFRHRIRKPRPFMGLGGNP
jgi:hypothetical protein